MKKIIQSLALVLVCALLCGVLTGCGSFSLGVKELHLKVGQASQIPLQLKDLPATYESSNPEAATVSDSGLIVAVAEGATNITVTNGKGKSAQCMIIVDRVEPTGLSFNPDSCTLGVDETIPSKLVFEPANTTHFAVTYESDNESIATVDANGVIHATGEGSAIVTATTENGVSAACFVTVLPYASSISMKPSLSLEKGDVMDLDVTMSPENCKKENLSWSSSDESIAGVVKGRVTASGVGTAVITATTENTGLTAQCEVTVTPAVFRIDNIAANVTKTQQNNRNNINYNVNVFVKGGEEPYSYRFDVLANNAQLASTNWIEVNGFNGTASVANSATCVLKITVRDATGKSISENYDLLQQQAG